MGAVVREGAGARAEGTWAEEEAGAGFRAASERAVAGAGMIRERVKLGGYSGVRAAAVAVVPVAAAMVPVAVAAAVVLAVMAAVIVAEMRTAGIGTAECGRARARAGAGAGTGMRARAGVVMRS